MEIYEIVLVCCTIFFTVLSLYTLHKSSKVIPADKSVYVEEEVHL